MGRVEFIFDKAVYDRALADGLVPDEDDFEFYGMFFMGRQTQLLIELSAHPLKSKYYWAVSIIFSIFRTMDLYQMTKYESISDRIKRLANASNPPTHSLPTQPNSKARMFQSPTATIYQKKDYELPSALNFL